MDAEIVEEMQRYGSMLEQRGLNLSSHSGNMSVRRGDRMFIKRGGAMMGYLREGDVVEAGLAPGDGDDAASTEVGVHRAIYQETEARAVIHAHTPYAIALSLVRDEIVPVDDEGRYYVDEVPVLDVVDSIGSTEVERRLPPLLQRHNAAILKGHGTFARGENLEGAYKWVTVVESVCHIIYLVEQLGGETQGGQG